MAQVWLYLCPVRVLRARARAVCEGTKLVRVSSLPRVSLWVICVCDTSCARASVVNKCFFARVWSLCECDLNYMWYHSELALHDQEFRMKI